MILSSVDFPQPDGPMSETKSPRSTSSVTLASACTDPALVAKTIETSRHAISMGATG
jgi:hypothetical protein